MGRVLLARPPHRRLSVRGARGHDLVVRDGLVVEGRLYMEPVEVGGGDIDVAVQEVYKPPSEVPTP